MKFAHKPSLASFYDSLVLSIEFAIKNYIESWGQTFGTPDFDIRVLPCRPPGPKSQWSKKCKFIINSNRSTWGCYQRISRNKLLQVSAIEVLLSLIKWAVMFRILPDRFRFIPVPVHMDYGFRFWFRFKGFLVVEM